MATVKTLYPAGSATITISPQNEASSATLISGRQSDWVTNVSDLDLDHLVSGFWTAGTTPVAGTQVRIWIVVPYSEDLSTTPWPGGALWPDSFDGGDGGVAATSVGVLQGEARLGATLFVDSATSDRSYYCAPFSVAALFGGSLPGRYQLFIVHNTGVNANSTAGNFVWKYLRVQAAVA